MENWFDAIAWIEQDDRMRDFRQEDMTVEAMTHGMEAEVYKLSSRQQSAVLKLWNRHSRPDVGLQYQLLLMLHEQGLPVSRPLGWGRDPNGASALLTTYDGAELTKVNTATMTQLAHMLSSLHHMQAAPDLKLRLPANDNVNYFFPAIHEHPDLDRALRTVRMTTPVGHGHIIHGDFHIRNILEQDGKFTVIDWTNARLGEAGYDYAWSLLLTRIYISERLATSFRAAYLSAFPLPAEHLEGWEALACLRWVLLHRTGAVPADDRIRARARGIMSGNAHLIGYKLEL